MNRDPDSNAAGPIVSGMRGVANGPLVSTARRRAVPLARPEEDGESESWGDEEIAP